MSLPIFNAYQKRLLIAAAVIVSVLAVILFETAGGEDAVVEPEEGPGTWRDGFCIWTCEPIGGVPLRHKVTKLDDDWLCWCSDGHVYVIPK